ncbi:MAG TPA: GrdX family protein [Clostridia bacterium]|nr:GrdX family protein [Clostridia bacterium]
MSLEMKIITNNPLVNQAIYKNVEKVFVETGNIQGVLLRARDLIHKGHKLLSHPLSGSLKPNENPYKSIIISRNADGLEFDHLIMIEKGIETTEKFFRGKTLPKYKPATDHDFMVIDKSIVESGLKNNGGA